MKLTSVCLWSLSLFAAGQASELTRVPKESGVRRESGEEAQTLGLYNQWKDFWLTQLTLNIVGYASVIVPFYLMVSYLKRTQYFERAQPGFFTNVLKRIVVGREADGVLPSVTTTIPSIAVSQSTSSRAFMLMFCAGGLLFCHMLWGIFQERIMAFEYTENGKTERFRNSQFLVFMNRLFSLVVAGVVLLFSKQARSEAPMYLYGYASLSNILSSWFQYESLKYIIFPLMTLGKSCKVIAVMLMGKCVSKKTYETYEYASAFLISFGIFVFFMNTQEDKKHHQQTLLLSGLFLLIGYLACDSFTSNWQDKIFKEHKVKPLQMMFGVNLCSVLLTSVSLVQQGAYSDTMAFTLRHPTFFSDVLCLSLSSALGQLFIYKTINEFGPVIFTIIMTTRQALAVLFSCFYFNHPINLAGFVGIFIAFGAIFGQIYFKQRTKKQPATKQASKPTS